MYLWQIRHIPNRPQNLLKLVMVTAACLAVGVSLFAPNSFVAAQSKDSAADKKETDKKSSAAQEFFDRVRQELPNHQSIKAEITQVVSIGEQHFKIDGEYLSAGKKLKLKYKVEPDQGVTGEMLEVCDGKELWTQLELPSSKRITHRNVQQIMAAAAAASKRDVADTAISVELGMGGLVALLASLERTMTFDAIKDEQVEGRSRTVIQGRWKKSIFDQLSKDKDGSLPIFIPDLVRLTINSATLFPERLLYLKKIPAKKSYTPLVSLEFRDVEFDVPVDETAFLFEIPKGAVPEDVTKQYLDRLTPPATTKPAAK